MTESKMVPDSGPGKGMKQVQAGYGTSPEGRVLVPSHTGANNGGQLGLTNGPRPSTVIEDGKVTRVLTPPGVQPAAPTAVAALLREETEEAGAGAPELVYAAHPAYSPPPAQTPPPVASDPQGEQVLPPRVAVTITSVDSPAVRWRGRFHLVTVNDTCVALGYDTRFPWADSPLLPFPPMTLVRVSIQAAPAANAAPAQPLQVNAVFLDVAHTSNGVEYFVMPLQSAAFAEETPPA